MANQSTNRQLAVDPDGGWLTLKEAADLCDSTVPALKRLIQAGALRAFTVERGGKIKFRVSRASLIDAGLLHEGPPSGQSATIDLLALIRDQNQRIARLDDQRAQIAGQLGVALERLRSIDERLSYLEVDPEARSVVEMTQEPESPSTGEAAVMNMSVPARTGTFLRTSVGRVVDGTVGARKLWRRGTP